MRGYGEQSVNKTRYYRVDVHISGEEETSSSSANVLRQRAVRQRFGQMQPPDFLGAVEIRQRPRHAQYAVITARGQSHRFGGIAQQCQSLGIRLRYRFQHRGRRGGIGMCARQSRPA